MEHPLKEGERYRLVCGDCLETMRGFRPECFDCAVTSPPYWGMRNYGYPGEIGGEGSVQEYVERLSSVFREVWRVLKDDGSLWLNLGDRYFEKDLVGLPWRVAFRLKDDGWILRNDVIWNQLKGTQSCRDRLRDSYEHVFHFVKQRRYHYDADAIRIPPKEAVRDGGFVKSATSVSGTRYRRMIAESKYLTEKERRNAGAALDEAIRQVADGEIKDFRITIRGAQRPWHGGDASLSGRAAELAEKGFYIMKANSKGALPPDIWEIVTEDEHRTGSHCAVYPEALLRIPILATSRKDGIVLDPFSGTGTTAAAAIRLGRRAVGIDLSPEYTKAAEERLRSLAG